MRGAADAGGNAADTAQHQGHSIHAQAQDIRECKDAEHMHAVLQTVGSAIAWRILSGAQAPHVHEDMARKLQRTHICPVCTMNTHQALPEQRVQLRQYHPTLELTLSSADVGFHHLRRNR